jgi:hypothetical protein
MILVIISYSKATGNNKTLSILKKAKIGEFIRRRGPKVRESDFRFFEAGMN